MGFETLDNEAAAVVRIPPGSVRVGSRLAGRSGSQTRYLAIVLSPEAAKKISFHLPEQRIRIRAGTGDDVGKLALDVDAKGKFVAKKQKNGNYLITVNRNAIGGRFAMEFEPFIIDEPRVVPAQTTAMPACMFLKLPVAA